MGETAQHLLNYPDPTDTLAALPSEIQELARRVDERLPLSGTAAVPITAVNTDFDVTVNLPAGYFTSAPIVLATPLAQQNVHTWTVVSASASSFVLRARRSTGNTTVAYHWLAVRASS